MKTKNQKQADEVLIAVLKKCASYIKTVSENDINQADYDLLELVEETIKIKQNITPHKG